MSERREPIIPDDVDTTPAEEAPPLRFQGIVETEEVEPAPRAARSPMADPYQGPERRRRTGLNWVSLSRQTLLVTRLIAVFWLFAVFIGWPIGDHLAYMKSEGSSAGWTLWHAVSFEGFLLAIVASFLTILLGYIGSRLLLTVSAAETIASAAHQLISPDANAADNVRHVGAAIRGQMDSLSVGLDQALGRLAAVEAMIRQHVEAIETAGASMEQRASGAVGRIADERSRLIDLTEQLNAHADAFAAAIAAKAQASIEALHSADDLSDRAQAHLDERLQGLELAAQSALRSFNALGEALGAADDTVRGSAGRLEVASDETRRVLEMTAKSAEAAAESAARNAANVGAAAARASADARKAADESIEASAREADRAARAAVETTEREAQRVAEAANRVIDSVKRSTESAVAAALDHADRATGAARDVAEAARVTGEAAQKASEDVARASSDARRSAEDAVAAAEKGAEHAEARNKALNEARVALEEENQRLESLIAEQRARADRLADAIASQTERLSKIAEAQIREQEAAVRLAEAQAALQARASEEARRAEEATKAAKAEAAAAAAAPASRPEDEAPAPERAASPKPRPHVEPSPDILDLGSAARGRSARDNGGGRQRLDELADDIALRKSANGAKRNKQSVSWREILDATDEAQPLDLAAASVTPPQPAASGAARAIEIITDLQNFTVSLETRLYGDPPPALRERFQRGDRNVFANRILRLNETDVKRRIRLETGRDKGFERDLHEFLQGFERLLEDATTSETADEELEEYLSSPLGRVYLLIGATVGYFA